MNVTQMNVTPVNATMSTTTPIRTPWSPESWSCAAVYGLGASGRAATALLRGAGIEVAIWDDRRRSDFEDSVAGRLESDPGVTLHLGASSAAAEALARSIDGLVVSPGVSASRPLLTAARARKVPIVAEVELAFAQVDRDAGDTVVAVTGSNGKSTTTALAGELIAAGGTEAVVCGNFGPPFSGEVLRRRSARCTFVVEVSSFQLEATDTFRPQAAALLNLSPDHIDRHGDMAAYLAAKACIFRRQGAGDVAVLNADDPHLVDLAVAGRRRLFSRRRPVGDGCYLDGDRVVESVPGRVPELLFALGDLPLAGTHNLENAMAAALLARSRAVESSVIARALRGFRGLPHRLELVAEHAGVRFFDDSKGTNVGATIASLDGFADGSVHLILGGRAKGADFADLAAPVAAKACRVYLIGEAADELARALAASEIETVDAGRLETAVAVAASAAAPGESVVLSPACASFDQFTSFVQRGQTFQAAVRALDNEEARDGA